MNIVPIKLKPMMVIFTIETWNDIRTIVKLCKDEVSWFSEVEKVETEEDIRYYVDKVYIPEQEVHATTTEMSPEGQAKIMFDVEDPNTLRCLGHSHVNMPTGMSGQDEDMFKSLYSNVDDHYISVIFNKSGKVTAWLCDHKLGYIINEIDVFTGEQPRHKTEEEWKEVIKKQVKPLLPKHKQNSLYEASYFYGTDTKKSTNVKEEEADNVCEACGAIASEAELHHADIEDKLCIECYREYKDDPMLALYDVDTCDICGVSEDEETLIRQTGKDFNYLCTDCSLSLAKANKISKKQKGGKDARLQ